MKELIDNALDSIEPLLEKRIDIVRQVYGLGIFLYHQRTIIFCTALLMRFLVL